MKTKGFTLIEIIVSLAIFSVVAVIAIGALVRVTSANRQAQAIQSGVNNISFILDAMSREMRVGSGFTCYSGSSLLDVNNHVTGGSPCTGMSQGPDTLITFTTSDGLLYAYLLSTPGYESTGATTTIYEGQQDIGSALGTPPYANLSFYPVTDPSVAITGYKVGVLNSSAYNSLFIRLIGHVGIKISDQSAFDVETTISDRTQ